MKARIVPNVVVSCIAALAACAKPTISNCHVPCSDTSGCPTGLTCSNGLCSTGSSCSMTSDGPADRMDGASDASDSDRAVSDVSTDDDADGLSDAAEAAASDAPKDESSAETLRTDGRDAAPSDADFRDVEDVNDSGDANADGLPASWIPSRVDGLEMWLDAVDLPVGTVVKWLDRSLNGHDALPVPGGEPQVVIDDATSLNVVNMAGGEDYLTVAGDLRDFTGGFAAFLVLSPRLSYSPISGQLPAFTHLLDFGSTLGRFNNGIILARQGDAEAELGFTIALSDATGLGIVAPDAVGNFSWQIEEIVVPGGPPATIVQAHVFRNGFLISTGPMYVPEVTSRLSNFIGESNFRLNGTEVDGHYRGHLGEILIYRSAINESDRHSIESYLARKWMIRTGP